MPDVRFMVHFKKAFCRLTHKNVRIRTAVDVDLDLCMRSLEYRLYPDRPAICRDEISLGLKFRMPFQRKPVGIARWIAPLVIKPNLKSLLLQRLHIRL